MPAAFQKHGDEIGCRRRIADVTADRANRLSLPAARQGSRAFERRKLLRDERALGQCALRYKAAYDNRFAFVDFGEFRQSLHMQQNRRRQLFQAELHHHVRAAGNDACLIPSLIEAVECFSSGFS